MNDIPRVVFNVGRNNISDAGIVKEKLERIESEIIGSIAHSDTLFTLKSMLMQLTDYVTLIAYPQYYATTEYNSTKLYLVYLYDEDAADYFIYLTGLHNIPGQYVKYSQKIQTLLSNEIFSGFNYYDLGERNE